MKLELLSPAKNLEFGREAVNHGADALYIGAPAFGARAAATNTIEDIEQLVNYAHLYGSKVFATVNTILFDNELDDAVKMIRQLYNIGVDALIVQDFGLLECDLPPIELHASTQCHNNTPERIKLMEQAGFKRAILARETSTEEMKAIREATHVDLEAFVHGALCVSYSGQCYMSQFLTGRSGNRGCCSQPCRSSYDLYTADGRLLIKEKHLLSLKDFDASKHIGSMIDAGITSFKIEGRLKDLSYVKNITAYYRQLLDNLMDEEREPASSGRCTFSFTPDPERTFNRGYTDYFLKERQPMASFDTQKSIGKPIGEVTTIGRYTLSISGAEPLANGDGLCFFNNEGHLEGFNVNRVEGRTVTPNTMPTIKIGTKVWRNNDQQFEKQLEKPSAERKIKVEMLFCATRRGFTLDLKDEDGVTATAGLKSEHMPAQSQIKSTNLIVKQLSKTGNTPFEILKVVDATEGQYFIPALQLNDMRRRAIEILIDNRIKHFRPEDTPKPLPSPTLQMPESVDYRANIVNQKAETFYKKHGTKEIERGVEQTGDYDDKILMTTRYCLRYELGCCLQGKNTHKPRVNLAHSEGLVLRNNDNRFRLEFDCKECQMHIFSLS